MEEGTGMGGRDEIGRELEEGGRGREERGKGREEGRRRKGEEESEGKGRLAIPILVCFRRRCDY